MSDFVFFDVRDFDPSAYEPASILCVDNPWFYADQKKIRKDGKTTAKGIGACHHYNQIKTPDLCELRIPELAADRCHLYLWATGPLMADAFQVMDAWRFEFKTFAHVWGKLNTKAWQDPQLWSLGLIESYRAKNRKRLSWTEGEPSFRIVSSILDRFTFKGPGYYSMANAEYLLLGVKGRPFKHAKGHKIRQLILWPRLEPHSRKPEIFQNAIQYMYPDVGPRIEIFARRARSNWLCMGNEEILEPYQHVEPDKTELEDS